MESRQSHVKKKIRPQQGKAHTWKYKDTEKEYTFCCHCSLVAQPCLTLQPPGQQHIRPPWPSPAPEVYPSSCPLQLVMPSSHLILWHPLLLLPSIFPSIRDFSNESSVCIRWPKYWRFSFSISPSNEYSGLISLKIDWFDLHTVPWTLRSLLQHHGWKASILWHSALFSSHNHTWLLGRP